MLTLLIDGQGNYKNRIKDKKASYEIVSLFTKLKKKNKNRK